MYHLSSAVYRKLGDNAGYIRMRGVEPIHHEQMVRQFLQGHAEAANSDIAELCQLNSWQARRLLQRMVDEGKLTRHGQGRWTRYRLANSDTTLL